MKIKKAEKNWTKHEAAVLIGPNQTLAVKRGRGRLPTLLTPKKVRLENKLERCHLRNCPRKQEAVALNFHITLGEDGGGREGFGQFGGEREILGACQTFPGVRGQPGRGSDGEPLLRHQPPSGSDLAVQRLRGKLEEGDCG